MSICKISDIEDRIGTVIPSISGTIISVFPSKSGKGQHGVWKLQNIKIQDNEGDCSVTLSGIDQDLNDSHKGKNIEFESVGTKFGLKGVSVEKRDYVNKKGDNVSNIGVKVTATAKISLEGSGMIQEDAQDDIPMAFSEKGKPLMPYPETIPSDIKVKISVSPQERIAQFGKLYSICINQADTIIKDQDMQEGNLRELATTFFIQAVREGLADKMQIGEEPF